MPTTTDKPRDIERELRDLNQEIATFEGEVAVAERLEEEKIAEHKQAGTLTAAHAVREIDALSRPAREKAARLAGLREQRERLRDEISSLTGGGRFPGATRRLLALGFDRGELDTLRQNALRRAPYTVPAGGVARHAVTAPAFPEDQLLPSRFLVEFAREQTRIADLIPQRPLESGIVAYLEETVAATAAAPVAAGDEKPESSPTFTKRTHEPQVIAHRCKVHNQDLMDLEGALDVIGGSLLRGLVAAENTQLLSGDGTGAEQKGFLDASSTVATVTRITAETRLNLILRAITAVRTGGFVGVDALVLHPSDYLAARTETAEDSGVYLAGGALEANAQDLWAIRTVLTTDVPQGTGLVGNFGEGAVLFVRESPRIDAGTSDDDFNRNMTTLRCEERIWLAITKPGYFKAIAF